MTLAVITDGTCDLPPELAAEHGVVVAPHHVIWGGQVYTDGVNLTSEAFYERLGHNPQLPKTSQPSPGEFAECYRQARARQHADGVLCVTTSKRITGAHGSAVLARDLVDFPVHVVDSNTATIPLGLIALSAADACQQGADLDEALRVVVGAAERSRFFFTLDTLEFLHRGGRIGGARRLLGTALNIKPILHVENGAVEAYESVRTRRWAIARLIEIAQKYRDKRPLSVGVIHSCAPEVDEFAQALQQALRPDLFFQTLACSAVGVYAGPRGLGFGLLYGV
jgi:fatty acid kinase fatty acid binding subunit